MVIPSFPTFPTHNSPPHSYTPSFPPSTTLSTKLAQALAKGLIISSNPSAISHPPLPSTMAVGCTNRMRAQLSKLGVSSFPARNMLPRGRRSHRRRSSSTEFWRCELAHHFLRGGKGKESVYVWFKAQGCVMLKGVPQHAHACARCRAGEA